ncbi:arylamine N-acetyltransferase family protein [Chryseobacterium pennipullorum]|uniref:Arylamine N-acetyltransferase n=1 Tax=Chryseobacterium pennipullorum TaxID=2258963 RepID=A0A3D9AU31_9FLAO|nr:arylamine N-acetyltransferase [Chryseobacterium pennipullorum]REC44672.1 arylamine N-acetyltransferase [Chryseobacterium pennipullorum]
MSPLQLQEYLARIHYSGAIAPDLETLEKIHQLHPNYIAFENIDSYTGTVPSLDPEEVFRKLVTDSRGGYCYEQNLLLGSMLKCIGFKVEMQLGRVVWKREENSSAARTHFLLIVTVKDQKYLVDCGFGTVTLTAPLRLNEEQPQQTPNGLFMISQKEGGYTLWIWKEKWLPIYRFYLESVESLDLEIANWYVATHPESGFKKNLVLSKVDEHARYTFTGHTLNIRKETGEKESVSIETPEEIFEMLKNIFRLKENAIEMLKAKIGN